MFERFRRRRDHTGAGTSIHGVDQADADARYAERVVAAWNALDDEAQADLLAAAGELKQVHDALGVTTVFRCHRGIDVGPLRTAADIRAEAAMLRADSNLFTTSPYPPA